MKNPAQETVREYEVTVENIMKEFAPGEIPVAMLWAMPDGLSVEMLALSDIAINQMKAKGVTTFGEVRDYLGSPQRGY